jgi:hypothetical protein
VEDNCVGPLYKQVFPPSLAPSIGFVGLPWKVRCSDVWNGVDFLGLPWRFCVWGFEVLLFW